MTRDKNLRATVLARDYLVCAKCGVLGTDPLAFDVDHIVPLSRGGEDTAENCQVLCVPCHRRKTYKIETSSLPRRTVGVRKTRDIGDAISLVRESQGLTQVELANTLGCDRFYLAKIESGANNIFVTRLLRTLKELGITMTLTFGEEAA